MTVAAQIAQSNVQLEFILCIEGMGWPTSLSDLSSVWYGDVFATTDLAGTLESDLGLSSGGLSLGLALPSGVSEEFDPRTLEFKSGSMSFVITDHDSKLLTGITPESSTGTVGKLYEDTAFNSTTFDIDNTDHTWSNDDLVWIADSELIQLKNRSNVTGNIYRYLLSPIRIMAGLAYMFK